MLQFMSVKQKSALATRVIVPFLHFRDVRSMYR